MSASDRDGDAAASRALAALAAAAPASAPPPGAALAAELAGLAAVPPRRPARQLAMLVAASLAYAAALLAIVRTRGDLGELPISWVVVAAGGWLIGFAVPAYLAVTPRAGTMTPRRRAAAYAAAATAIAFVGLGWMVHPSGPSSVYLGWDRFAHGHWCLWLGLATALVPIALGASYLRGALPTGSRWIAAALGAAGGCLGGLLLHLHCPVADEMHVGLIHGGVVALAAVLAAVIVPKLLGRTFD